MKHTRTHLLAGLLALAATGALPLHAEVRRDPLVGPPPGAWHEDERPLTGRDRMERVLDSRSPRDRANAVRTVEARTEERLPRTLRIGSPRGLETWGSRRN